MNYNAFHKLTYGLYIISSEFDGQKAGYIANTAFQVTSSPAQLAISCHKQNATTDIISKSGIFSVSVLKKDIDTKIIGKFGFNTSSDTDKFSDVRTITAITGAPIILNESIAWFDCKVKQTIDVGSHFLFIGEILNGEIISDEEPLSYDYYRETYKMHSPEKAPTYIEPSKLETAINSEKEIVEEKQTSTTKEHICIICGFVYNEDEGDPTIGIPPGTPFEELPEDYRCPICNAGKEYFREA